MKHLKLFEAWSSESGNAPTPEEYGTMIDSAIEEGKPLEEIISMLKSIKQAHPEISSGPMGKEYLKVLKKIGLALSVQADPRYANEIPEEFKVQVAKMLGYTPEEFESIIFSAELGII